MTHEQVCKLKLKGIDVAVFDPVSHKKTGMRTCLDIANEVEERLKAFDLHYEYISTPRDQHCLIDKTALFPDTAHANELVTFMPGGNEGYSIYIGTEEFRDGRTSHDREIITTRPIRIKLLCGLQDALVVYAFVYRLFLQPWGG